MMTLYPRLIEVCSEFLVEAVFMLAQYKSKCANRLINLDEMVDQAKIDRIPETIPCS